MGSREKWLMCMDTEIGDLGLECIFEECPAPTADPHGSVAPWAVCLYPAFPGYLECEILSSAATRALCLFRQGSALQDCVP